MLDEPLAKKLGEMFKGKSVVEFGAGKGRYTASLREHGVDARGYDGVKDIESVTNGLIRTVDLTSPADLGEDSLLHGRTRLTHGSAW